jgi:acyl transferase domain-containing protein
MLELAWTAMEDAGIRPTKTDPNYIGKVGVWAGTYATTYLNKNLLPNQDRSRNRRIPIGRLQ